MCSAWRSKVKRGDDCSTRSRALCSGMLLWVTPAWTHLQSWQLKPQLKNDLDPGITPLDLVHQGLHKESRSHTVSSQRFGAQSALFMRQRQEGFWFLNFFVAV